MINDNSKGRNRTVKREWKRTVKGESQLLNLGLTSCNRIGIVATDEFLRMDEERFNFFCEGDDEKCEKMFEEYKKEYEEDMKKFSKNTTSFRRKIVNEIVRRGCQLKKLSQELSLNFESIIDDVSKYERLKKRKVVIERENGLTSEEKESEGEEEENKNTKELKKITTKIGKYEKGYETLLGLLFERKLVILENLVCRKDLDRKGSEFKVLMKNVMVEHPNSSFFCTSKKHTVLLISKDGEHLIFFDSVKRNGLLSFCTLVKIAKFVDFDNLVFPEMFKNWGSQCDVVVVGPEKECVEIIIE